MSSTEGTTTVDHPATAGCGQHGRAAGLEQHSDRCRARRRRRRAVAAVTAVAGVGLVSTGALAAWQATTTASTGALSAADVTVQMLDANGGAFTAAVANMLPGDYFDRYVDVAATGTVPTTVTGQVAGTGALSAGMLVQVDSCSVPWTRPAGVSTCTGTTTSVVPQTSLSSPVAVSLGTVTPGAGNARHVRYRATLRSDASSTLMGATGGITATMNGSAIGGRDLTGP